MSVRAALTFPTLALATLLGIACGGSASSGGAAMPPPAPAAVQFVTGTITAKAAGTLQVNHLTLSTARATIRVEDAIQPETELRPGMVVKVKARHDGRTGEALEIAFEDAVKGRVLAVGTSTLTVGGQGVRIDDATEFEDGTLRLGSIHAGDRVRVSGVPDDRGGLRATRIETHQAGTGEDFELKGWVSGLGPTGFTLKVTPDAGAADTYAVNLLGGATLPAGLANGAFVEVRSLKAVQAGNGIEASAISLEDGRPGDPQGEAEVEGLVTSGTSAQFLVAGVTVLTGSGTSWSGGLPADLVPGAKVEAEGRVGAGGALAATKVSFRANLRLQGAVVAPAPDGAGAGSFRLDGISIRVDALTDQRTALAALTAGTFVEVRGMLGRDGHSVVATRMEATGDDRPILQGPVTAKDAAARTFVILGKTIAAGGASASGHNDFSGAEGPPLSLDAFFSAIVVGETVVKARGRDAAAFVDPVLTAKEVQLEGER